MSVFAGVIIALILLFCFTAFTGAPFVPSKKKDLKKAFTKAYNLSAKDTLIDLGAGSGTAMKVASETGAKVIGLELNPVLATIVKLRFHHNSRASIKCCNFYNFKFPKETTVVYTFADSRDIKKIYQKIEQEAKRLHKTIIFISYAFKVPNIKEFKKVAPFYVYKIH